MRLTRRSLFALFVIVAISLLVASPILSFDKPSKPTPGTPPGQGQQNGGNGQENGNHGNHNGNGGQQATQPPADNSSDGSGDSVSTPPPATDSASADSSSANVLGCQKNNPGRLDCSSLDVSGQCQGNIAVFTITNSGSPGDGDMRAATSYRLLVDGVVVQSGSVQLAGGTSTQISYDGGGTVTLEADQQIGHPGHSHPQTTLTCSDATPVPTEEPSPTPTDTPTVEAPNVTAVVICWSDGSTAFLISNSGGDMTDPAAYHVVDQSNNTIDQGSEQLAAGASDTLVYAASYGPVTLYILDLVVTGDPSGCVAPTPEVTPPVTGPSLSAQPVCWADGSTAFIITNNGSDMLSPSSYTVTDEFGNGIDQGSIQLAGGEGTTLVYPPGIGGLTLIVDGGLAYSVISCAMPTPEVSPPPELPNLTANAQCWADGSTAFIITNIGGDMTDLATYLVVDASGNTIDQSDIQLMSGETTTLVYPSSLGSLTLMVGGGMAFATIECNVSTPDVTPTVEPTQEVTPEPTIDVTPTVEPTQEVTPEPTVEPSPIPTSDAPLGCQKNNPDRLDCSSLQVKAYCDGTTAVFIITNMGQPGEGDMRAATDYRVIVGGSIVDSGTVQLAGRTSTEVRYDGDGTVTLEADQQVGHPGGSQPQATITCG